MTNRSYTRGQTLLELLLAIALATSVIALAASAAAHSGDALRASESELQVQSAVRGCIDAVRSVRDAAYTDLTEGEHALVFDGGRWELEQSIAPEYAGPLVTIEGESAGARRVTCSVERTSGFIHTRELVLTTRITNWRQNAASQYGMHIDTGTASVASTSAALNGLRICNDTDEDRTLTALRMMWDDNPLLMSLVIDGVEVYGPEANVQSNQTLAPAPVTVAASSCVLFDTILFDSPLTLGHLFVAVTIDDEIDLTRHVYFNTL